ncbi:MAG: hypothetical protein SGPRY_004114, partial [Prymnesium sp.]
MQHKRARVEEPNQYVGVASSKGRKQVQEDVPLLCHRVGERDRSFYAVLDGHGGSNCAAYAAERLPELLASELGGASTSSEIKEGIKNAFTKCDEEVLGECASKDWSDGCCVIGVLLDCECTPPRVYCANLGDSRASVIPAVSNAPAPAPTAGPSSARSAGSEDQGPRPQLPMPPASNTTSTLHSCLRAIPLSKDHSPTEPKELKRIQHAGGRVTEGRVCGSLEVSRSLGDARLKNHGLIALPDITSFAVGPEQRFVLLACDGLWKAFSGKEAIEFVHERLPRMDARRSELRSLLGDAVKLSALTKEAVSKLQKERDATSEAAILKELVFEAVHDRNARDNVTCIL